MLDLSPESLKGFSMPRAAIRRRALAAALASAAMLSACTSSSGDAGAPKTPAVAPDAAQTTAATAVGAVATSSLDATAAGAAAREKAFVGAALQSANAYAKTLPGRTAADKAAGELSTTGVKVLSLADDDTDYNREYPCCFRCSFGLRCSALLR